MWVCNLLLLVFLLRAPYCVHTSSICKSFCVGVSSGTVLVNPLSRHSYYVCVNDEARLFECGNGLVYDPKSFMCLREANENTSGRNSCDCDGSNEGTSSTTTCASPPATPAPKPCPPEHTPAPCTPSTPCHHGRTTTPCVTRTPPCDHNHHTKPCTPKPCDNHHDQNPCDPNPCVVKVKGYRRTSRDCRNEADGVVLLDLRNRVGSRKSRTTRYYVCQGGRVTNRDCDDNYWFDQNEGKCVSKC